MARRRRRQRRGPVVTAADPLSSLPDELLRRILFFAPTKEAASTCVLSRRWRSLWRTSGAVNLDTRSYDDLNNQGHEKARRAFIRSAEAALAAAHAHGSGPVTRLTVHVEATCVGRNALPRFLNRRRFRALFSHPAARRVEELHAAVVPDRAWGELCKLSFRKLPSEALRVLHITNFSHLKPPQSGAAAFPRLTDLRLQGCTVTFSRLQRIVDAAPQLSTLYLESSSFPRVDNVTEARRNFNGKPEIQEEPCYRLVCRTITTLVFTNCNGGEPYLEGGLEIEAPRLRHFRYHGLLLVKERIKFQPLLKLLGTSNIVEADLHIMADTCLEKYICVPFWLFIHDFSATKVLRLKMDFVIDHVAIVDKEHVELLSNIFFHNLERLDLEGRYKPATKNAAVAIANFLHCSPVVRDLRLKLTKVSISYLRLPYYVGTQAHLDFVKSINRFKSRKSGMNTLGGENDDEDYEVSDIPGLSEHSFDCLQSYLRRVSLQFWMEKPNCFGVQLAKFFTNNAHILEEMHIDDGNHIMCEHMNCKLRRWSSKRRILVSSFRESYRPRKRQMRQFRL